MRGILLAGGKGSRLYPLTAVTVKQLLPVYDKPMIFYPLSVLMLAGIKEIMIISTPDDTPKIKQLLGSGADYGVNLFYEIQPSPDGIAQAFLIGRDFINNQPTCLVLGDNFFFSHNLTESLSKCKEFACNNLASIVLYNVIDPKRYGVVKINSDGKIISIEEKPQYPKSNSVIVGLYFFPSDVVKQAESVIPSKRGELEITSVINNYLEMNRLEHISMGRGSTWLDMGTPQELLEASIFVNIIEKRQGLKIACIEEIAYNMKYISRSGLIQLINSYGENDYAKYLKCIIKE